MSRPDVSRIDHDPTTEPECTCYPGGFTPDSYEGPHRHCAVHGKGPTTEPDDRIPCGDPANCASGGDCIDYADEVRPSAERPTTEPDAEVERLTREVFRLTEGPIVDYDKADPEHVEYLRMIVQHVLDDLRSNPAPAELEVRVHAPSQVEPDAEVERLARVCADADAGSPQPHPIDNDRRTAAAVLADLRERYILVPRDGAEEDEQWGEQDSAWPGMRRTVVYGPWEVAR